MPFSWENTDRLLAEARAAMERMSPDDPLRGLVQDLAKTALHTLDMVENAVQGMYSGTLSGRILWGNPALAGMLGYPSVEAMLPIEDFGIKHYMNPEERQGLMRELRDTGRVVNREVRLKRVDGTPVWGLANIRLFTDACGEERIDGVTVDITARKKAEEELAASERRHRRILETAGEGFIFMDQDLVIREVNEAYCRLLGRTREEVLGRTPLEFAAPQFADFLRRNRDRLMAADYRSFEGGLIHADGHAVPILVHGNTLRCQDGTPVGNVAFVADMTESKKALALAAEVQRSLMPSRPPVAPGLSVAGRSVPSQFAGGDYFDYIEGYPVKSPGFRVAVGDVTGHGLDAALLMSTARGFFRMRSAQPGSIAEVAADLNLHLARDTGDTGRFMTLFILEIGPGGELCWVRAGHEPALVYDPGRDDFFELGGRGMALGVLPDASFELACSRRLASGQVLAVGTDGIWEARSASGEMFGKERFRESVRRSARLGAEGVVEAVFEDLRGFAGQALEDDATLVVVKATAEPWA